MQGEITDKENTGAQSEHAVTEAERPRHADRGVSKVSPVDVVENVQHEDERQKSQPDNMTDVFLIDLNQRVDRSSSQWLPHSQSGTGV